MTSGAPPPRRLFPILWCGGLVLFWALVAANWEASKQAPKLAATYRALPSREEHGVRQDVWLYSGPRPAEGEILRVFYRQGQGLNVVNRVEVTAFLGSVQRPNHDEPFGETAQPAAEDFFEYQWVDLPPWPEERELWLGLTYPAGDALMMEQGKLPFDNMGQLSYTRERRPGAEFRAGTGTWFSSIHAMPVAEGAPVPSPARPFHFIAVYTAIMLLPLAFLKGFRRWWLANALFQAVLLWKTMEVLFPSQYLWGGYYHHRTGTGVFWAGLIALQTLTVPWVMETLARGPRRWWISLARWRASGALSRWLHVKRNGDLLPLALIPVAAIAVYQLAVRLPCQVLYGDAFGALAIPGYDYHNPFATGFYHAWRDWIFWRGERMGQPVIADYRDLGLVARFVTLWAPVFAAGAGVLAFLAGRGTRERLQVFGALLLMKTLQTHLGYAEVYGPALAVQVWVLAALLWGYRHRRVLLGSSLSFFGYLFHMAGAMALPAVLVLWANALLRTERRVRWLAIRLPATAAVALMIWVNCLAVLFLFKHDGNPESFSRHVPALKVSWRGEDHSIHGLAMLAGYTGRPKKEVLLQWSEPHYTQFYLLPSWEHASQIAGAIIFLAGPVVPWFLMGFLLSRRWGWRSPERLGIGLAGLAFLGAALVLSTNFPYPKDWDVFSTNALWWFAGLFVCLRWGGFLPARAGRWLLGALLLYLLWDTAPWILYNASWGPAPEDTYYIFM